MNNAANNAAKTNERDQIAAELDKALANAINTRALQTSDWYQARKARMMALDQQG